MANTKVRRTLSFNLERLSIGFHFRVFIIVSLLRKGNENPAEKQEEAELWEETFRTFSYEIRKLALKYPADVVEEKTGRKQTQQVSLYFV